MCRVSEKDGISKGTKKYAYQEHQNEREKGNKSEKIFKEIWLKLTQNYENINLFISKMCDKSKAA